MGRADAHPALRGRPPSMGAPGATSARAGGPHDAARRASPPGRRPPRSRVSINRPALARQLHREAQLRTQRARASLRHALGRDHELFFERLRVAHGRNVGAAQAADRRVEIEERLLGDHRADLGADAAELVVLVDDQQLARLAHALEDRGAVHRPNRAQVDHFDREAFGFELVGRVERLMHVVAVRDDGQLRAGLLDVGLADRNRVMPVGDFAFDRAVRFLVFEEQDRIGILDRRGQADP